MVSHNCHYAGDKKYKKEGKTKRLGNGEKKCVLMFCIRLATFCCGTSFEDDNTRALF